jgi:hypothetical protein
MTDLFKLILGLLASLFRSRAKLEAEILVLRQQINVLRRRASKKNKRGDPPVRQQAGRGYCPRPHLAEQACGRDYDPYSERDHARTQQNFIEKFAHYSPCSPLRRECRTYPCRSDIAHRDRTAWVTMQSAAN